MSSCGCQDCLRREEDEEHERKLKREGVADFRFTEITGFLEMDEIDDATRDPLTFHTDFANFLKSEQNRMGVGIAECSGGEMGLGSFMSPDSVLRLLCHKSPKDIFNLEPIPITIGIELTARTHDFDTRNRKLSRAVC